MKLVDKAACIRALTAEYDRVVGDLRTLREARFEVANAMGNAMLEPLQKEWRQACNVRPPHMSVESHRQWFMMEFEPEWETRRQAAADKQQALLNEVSDLYEAELKPYRERYLQQMGQVLGLPVEG